MEETMEKEKVLEIEYQEVFDEVAVRIKYQNFGVLKRGEFYEDSRILLVDKEGLKKILEIVNKINEKYGIPKRWRADNGHYFYYITSNSNITIAYDDYSSLKSSFYDLGNYFQTEEEAQKIIDSKEWQDLWSKVRAGEIGNE